MVFLESLDPNIVFTILVGGTLSIIIPITYQYNRHKFENTVKVVDELQTITQLRQQARQYIHNKIHNKYFKFYQTTTDPGILSVEVIPREKPLDNSLVNDYLKFREKDHIISTSNRAYSILASKNNEQIKILEKKRDELLAHYVINYFKICHSELDPKEVLEIIVEINMHKLPGLKELEEKILWEYVNSFSMWYKLKKYLGCLKKFK